MSYSEGESECNLPVKPSSQCGLAVSEHLTAFSFYVGVVSKLHLFLFIRDSHLIQDVSSQRGREELKEGNDIKILGYYFGICFLLSNLISKFSFLTNLCDDLKHVSHLCYFT